MTDAPISTYRLQLHKDFTFDAAIARLPYLAALGISHLYLSPILTARAGSMHGYDVVDHGAVNPELGGEDGLRRLVKAVRAQGLGLVVDIVPNHMAVGGADNAWWLDALEWGRDSRHASYFDIDWDVPDPAIADRVFAPFLGKPYGQALEDGEIELRFDAVTGQFFFAYYHHRFPMNPALYAVLLRGQGDDLTEISHRFRASLSSRRSRNARHDTFAEIRGDLARVIAQRGDGFEQLLKNFSPKDAEGRERLHRLLERQNFRLAWWRTASDEINWRRFFDVIDLAGLRMQDAEVFEAVHATTFRLYREGLIDGLRIDHVDGLADPRAYCRKLRRRMDEIMPSRPEALPRGPAYIVVEKILAPGEKLALDWRTDGTSGYVFMNEVGALLHDPRGRDSLAGLWGVHGGGEYAGVEEAARRRIPNELFSADFAACAHALHAIARSEPATRDWSLPAVKRVLAEFIAHFPVYRTYVDSRGRSAADAKIMAAVVADASRTCRPGEQPLVALFDRWLGGEPLRSVHGTTQRRLRRRALGRFQQLTSPIAAKAVEDTAFYRFGVLVSRNEVGSNPAQFGMTTGRFHRACSGRATRYPHAMLATATHDHKRGEDVRARLAVLSEVPDAWAEAVSGWRRMNEGLRDQGGDAPDLIDEYILYQMLLGAWPFDLAPDDRDGLTAYAKRLSGWLEKALREAKRRSNWVEPNVKYETACRQFLERLLDPTVSATFLLELRALVDRIAPAGAVNGLSQMFLRLTTPGVPDTFQGTEFWDLSLVDPDNRRPVDYDARMEAFGSRASDDELLAQWRSGHAKQRLLARVLTTRRSMSGLFASGSYLPLRTRGPNARSLVAFVREHLGQAMLAVAPRCAFGAVEQTGSLRFESGAWDDTFVELPAELAGRPWRDALSGGQPEELSRDIRAADLLKTWPVGLRLTGV